MKCEISADRRQEGEVARGEGEETTLSADSRAKSTCGSASFGSLRIVACDCLRYPPNPSPHPVASPARQRRRQGKRAAAQIVLLSMATVTKLNDETFCRFAASVAPPPLTTRIMHSFQN